MSTIAISIVTGLLFLGGIMGTVVPGVPGIGLIFLGVLLFAWNTGFSLISGMTVAIFGLVALLAWGTDLMGSMVGAKVAGGKKWALFGTILGALMGIMAGPPGMMLGAFVGGFLGAVLEGANHQKALKVALFTVVGILGATVMQLMLAVAMILAFLIAVFV